MSAGSGEPLDVTACQKPRQEAARQLGVEISDFEAPVLHL